MILTRTYSELILIDSFEERFEYLSLQGTVGDVTFGHERHLNQTFYRSNEWRNMRYHVITRDLGCDLAVPGREIPDRIIIHHLNPMEARDIRNFDSSILDPENLITTSHSTHNAIHYGDQNLLPRDLVERKPGDTKLW